MLFGKRLRITDRIFVQQTDFLRCTYRSRALRIPIFQPFVIVIARIAILHATGYFQYQSVNRFIRKGGICQYTVSLRHIAHLIHDVKRIDQSSSCRHEGQTVLQYRISAIFIVGSYRGRCQQRGTDNRCSLATTL